MSKSKGNVTDPLHVMEQFGTDALRFTLRPMSSPGARHQTLRKNGRRLPQFLQTDLERGSGLADKLDGRGRPSRRPNAHSPTAGF
jgi:hypothetical protein